ncbi:PREDICTED: uncharacterized protein LOC104815103 [Tarenaya hassleriana]|uniref:uncharacterized protein LOC104815103 n=1 Tax=Tarenaya hassleriana TaxID=28532 RepID=UPI00053C4FFA|nr:PREDICTED: uncharacterized protein LOC104815103 [Tarenaya hassleriana]
MHKKQCGLLPQTQKQKTAMAHEERVKKQKKSLIISFYKFSTSIKSLSSSSSSSSSGHQHSNNNKSEKTRIIPSQIDKLPLPTSETTVQCKNINTHISKTPYKEEDVVVEGGRRSVSYVETMSVAAAAAMLSVKIVAVDMPGFMQSHAFRCARRTFDSLDKFSSKHMAFNLKKEFDKVYGPAWHCIVGSNFGSFVTHSTGCFLYFSMEKLYILLFRTKVRRALD